MKKSKPDEANEIKCDVCEGHGIFEFRPKSLKAAIFLGIDGLDMEGMLRELVEQEPIEVFDVDGAVRNFCKWQRPSKPSYKLPAPEPVR